MCSVCSIGQETDLIPLRPIDPRRRVMAEREKAQVGYAEMVVCVERLGELLQSEMRRWFVHRVLLLQVTMAEPGLNSG